MERSSRKANGSQADSDLQALRDEVVRLAPWHLNVEITPELSTRAFRDGDLTAEQTQYEVRFLDHHDWWMNEMRTIYPEGLSGRTVLDCACNCGAYSFWMREMGGGGGLGFDVRQLWIDQARFLQKHRTTPSDGLRFEVCDLYDLDTITDEQFDVTLFKGIFYHLPDPIHGLKLVADRTRELLIVNTAARNDLDDGMLVAEREGIEHPMSGVYGLNWLPTGPKAISEMLISMGFPATRVSFWERDLNALANRGRLEVLGARDEATFTHFDSVRAAREQERAENAERQREQQAKREKLEAEREARRAQAAAQREARRLALAEERKAALRAKAAAEREAARRARQQARASHDRASGQPAGPKREG